MTTAARTTGADAQAEELRRRNVAAQFGITPNAAQASTKEKEKSKDKVREAVYCTLALPVANQTTAFRAPHFPGRHRVHLGSVDLHLLRFLHAHVQDWSLANCHLG